MNSVDWKNATPEQKNLWKYASSLIAYTTITPLFYNGPLVGSEFSVYNAGKLYIAIDGFCSAGGVSVVRGQVLLYDMANAITMSIENNSLVWNVTTAAINYQIDTAYIKNNWFSRISLVAYNYICFNGYRLNV
jgi:hypothetical protein